MTIALVLSLFLADPTPQQRELLKIFKDEFVAVTPEGGTLRPFAIAKYEVPQNLWQAIMGENPSRWKGQRNSVEMLTLADAREFCREATSLMRSAGLIDSSQTIRLPTEAEWEYAARAGTKTKYSFGDDVSKLGEYAWFTGNAAGNDPAVGAKKPNPLGLYDIHGYLWEWTNVNIVSADGAQGVLRGGSWKDKAEALTSDSRRVVSASLADAR